MNREKQFLVTGSNVIKEINSVYLKKKNPI